MDYDLLLKGGRVVDGSGLPSYVADVGTRNGKIAGIGRLKGTAGRTIDVDGLAVSPGFIDHHTHLDAQICWDPYGTCEPQHGVTSVVMGNCGLALAPVLPGGEEELVQSFVRVEAIPRVVLEQGVPWGWRSYGEYLGSLQGRIGINVGGLVGHIALRHYVLGAEATQRPATAEEIERMCALVAESLDGGALGLSTNRNSRHYREDGLPVSSRLAEDEELFALCDVLGERNAGVVQTILGLPKVQDIGWYGLLAQHTGRPVTFQSVLHRWSAPDLWHEQLDALAEVVSEGHRIFGLTTVTPLANRFTLKNAQVFDEFPTWKNLMFVPEPVRKQAFASPEVRAKLRNELANPPALTTFHRRWDLVQIVGVAQPEHQQFVGKSVAHMAALRGQDPLDAFLDLSLEENLETVYWNANSGGDPEAMGQILRSPHILAGLSDAGAHVQFLADFGYGASLLGLWVRERGVLSLEQAVHKLTFQVASVYGIENRGLLRRWYAADFAIFDPATIKAGEPEWADDFPGGTRRLIQRSQGMHYTVVNGRVIWDDGRLTGDLPGEILRGTTAAA